MKPSTIFNWTCVVMAAGQVQSAPVEVRNITAAPGARQKWGGPGHDISPVGQSIDHFMAATKWHDGWQVKFIFEDAEDVVFGGTGHKRAKDCFMLPDPLPGHLKGVAVDVEVMAYWGNLGLYRYGDDTGAYANDAGQTAEDTHRSRCKKGATPNMRIDFSQGKAKYADIRPEWLQQSDPSDVFGFHLS